MTRGGWSKCPKLCARLLWMAQSLYQFCSVGQAVPFQYLIEHMELIIYLSRNWILKSSCKFIYLMSDMICRMSQNWPEHKNPHFQSKNYRLSQYLFLFICCYGPRNLLEFHMYQKVTTGLQVKPLFQFPIPKIMKG